MNDWLKKGALALVAGATLAAVSAPQAEAQWRHGWRGGGWGGHHVYRGGWGYHRGYRGGGVAAGVAAGLVGGALIGSLAARPAYAYDPYYAPAYYPAHAYAPAYGYRRVVRVAPRRVVRIVRPGYYGPRVVRYYGGPRVVYGGPRWAYGYGRPYWGPGYGYYRPGLTVGFGF
jgi:hypothetical protein